MNIALINAEYPSRSLRDHGGIATYTYTIAKALAGQGHTVFVLVREGTLVEALDGNIHFRTFGYRRLPWYKRQFCRILHPDIQREEGYSRGAFELCMELHRTFHLDVVEIPEYNGLACAFGDHCPFTVVCHFHTPSQIVDGLNRVEATPQRKKWYQFEAEALRQARGYRCPSESLKQRVCQLYGIEAQAVRVIRQPVDIELFESISQKEKERDRVHVLFVGRLECRKGAEILLQSIKRVLSLDERIHFSVAGETAIAGMINYRESIEKALSLEERFRVWFLGAVKRSDLPVLYLRSHIFFIPSLFDNAPNTLYEAMAAGLPVIGSDVGGINETIVHGENGLLFNPGSVDEVIDCFKRIVEEKGRAQQMGTAALSTVREHHALECIARQSVEFYQTLTEK